MVPQAHGKLRLRLMAVRLYNCREVNKKAAQGSITQFFSRVPQQQQHIDKKEAEPVDHAMAPIEDGSTGPAVPATTMQTTTCPICNQKIPADEALSNQHVDECLNTTAIKEMLEAETQDRLLLHTPAAPSPSTPPKSRQRPRAAGPLDAFVRGKGK